MVKKVHLQHHFHITGISSVEVRFLVFYTYQFPLPVGDNHTLALRCMVGLLFIEMLFRIYRAQGQVHSLLVGRKGGGHQSQNHLDSFH